MQDEERVKDCWNTTKMTVGVMGVARDDDGWCGEVLATMKRFWEVGDEHRDVFGGGGR